MDKTLQHLHTAGAAKALIQIGAETCMFNIRYPAVEYIIYQDTEMPP